MSGDGTQTLYEWAGGAEAMSRFLDAFYHRVEEDDCSRRSSPEGSAKSTVTT
jgi:truncated hemoglobin YjbI